MDFSESENLSLEKVCRAYIKVKELVSTVEDIDVKSGANVQINKEFRDALTHLIRVLCDKILDNGSKKAENNDYYLKNLDKAIGHIYRAGYDAIDGIAICLRELFVEIKTIPAATKIQVVPDFVQRIQRIDTVHKKLQTLKQAKDIDAGSAAVFDALTAEVSKIKQDYTDVEAAIPSMREIEKAERRKNRWHIIIWPLITGALFFFLGKFSGTITALLP